MNSCATEEYNEALLAQDDEWAASLNAFEVWYLLSEFPISHHSTLIIAYDCFQLKNEWKVRQSSILSGSYTAEQRSITVPVIFHIVSTNPFTVPDSAIAFQLQVLQDDFSANNNDYNSGVPEEFHPVRSGDTLIRFYTQEVWAFHVVSWCGYMISSHSVITFSVLRNVSYIFWLQIHCHFAHWQITVQVLRVATNVPSFGTNNAIKFSSQGGSDVVEPDRNLNFWAGTLSGGMTV